MRRYLSFIIASLVFVIIVVFVMAIDNSKVVSTAETEQVSSQPICEKSPELCVQTYSTGLDDISMYLGIDVTTTTTTIVEEVIVQQEVVEQAQTTERPQSFDMPSDCEGKVIPAYIIMRESHCNYGAVNQTGCGGAGCFGMYQIHGMHWTNGACSDLDWTIPEHQDECAYRLSSGGTNLRPWSL